MHCESGSFMNTKFQMELQLAKTIPPPHFRAWDSRNSPLPPADWPHSVNTQVLYLVKRGLTPYSEDCLGPSDCGAHRDQGSHSQGLSRALFRPASGRGGLAPPRADAGIGFTPPWWWDIPVDSASPASDGGC